MLSAPVKDGLWDRMLASTWLILPSILRNPCSTITKWMCKIFVTVLIIFLYLTQRLTVTCHLSLIPEGLSSLFSLSLFPMNISYLPSLASFSPCLMSLSPLLRRATLPSSPLFVNSSISCSPVLQYPWLPTAWLCSEPDRGSSQQHGALGLRPGVQADWKGHSRVQEEHLWLLRLGRSGPCMSRWAHRLWQPFISDFSQPLTLFFWSLPPWPCTQQADRPVLKAYGVSGPKHPCVVRSWTESSLIESQYPVRWKGNRNQSLLLLSISTSSNYFS